jgi:hypothetical protein
MIMDGALQWIWKRGSAGKGGSPGLVIKANRGQSSASGQVSDEF